MCQINLNSRKSIDTNPKKKKKKNHNYYCGRLSIVGKKVILEEVDLDEN